MNKTKRIFCWIFWVFIWTFIFYNLFGNNNNALKNINLTKKYDIQEEEQKPKIKKKKVKYVTINKLQKDYENVANGNKIYKDKEILVKGSIRKISQVKHKYFILLNKKSNSIIEHTSVIFYMNSLEEEKLSKLKKGQTINILGICKGKGTFGLEFKDCKIINEEILNKNK